MTEIPIPPPPDTPSSPMELEQAMKDALALWRDDWGPALVAEARAAGRINPAVSDEIAAGMLIAEAMGKTLARELLHAAGRQSNRAQALLNLAWSTALETVNAEFARTMALAAAMGEAKGRVS